MELKYDLDKLNSDRNSSEIFSSSIEMIKKFFFGGLIILFIQRVYYFYNFSINYTDNDQAIMWLASRDYSRMEFHEPFFYGQSYNLMVESLLAAPLVGLGVSPWVALPIATHCLAYFGFIIVPIITYRNKHFLTSLFILILFLAFSVQLQLIFSLPRGFITGPVLAVFVSCILATKTKWRFFAFTFGSMITTIVLQSAVLVWAPIFIYCLANLIIQKNKQFIILKQEIFQLILGLALGGVFYFSAKYYYVMYPEFGQWMGVNATDLSFDEFKNHIKIFDLYFDPYVPNFLPFPRVITKIAILLLLCSIILSLKYERWALAASISSGLVLIILILAHGKSTAGSKSIFYSYARYFTAVPFQIMFLALAVERYSNDIVKKVSINLKKYNNINYIYGSFCVLFFIFTSYLVVFQTRSDISKAIMPPWGLVTVESVELVKSRCSLLDIEFKKYNPDYVVVEDPFLSYACPAIYPEINTLFLKRNDPQRYDRRTWVIKSLDEKIARRILVIEDKKSLTPPLISTENVSVNFIDNDLGNNYLIDYVDSNEITVKNLLESKLSFKVNLIVNNISVT